MARSKARFGTLLFSGAAAIVLFPSCKRKAACESGAQAQVVGGSLVSQPIADEAGKRTVAIGYSTGGLCTGVLVAADAILSAAHCVHGKSPTTLLFGTSARVPSHRRTITTTELHPTEDLAILRFSDGIPEGFAATRLADARTTLTAGTPLVVAGYGVVDPARRSVFGTLFRATVPFLGLRAMPGRVKRANASEEVHARNPFVMSDGRAGTGVCMGDSGGPAFLRADGRLVVVALTQGGEGLGRCGDEVNAHTDVRPLRDWIVSRVRVDESLFEETGAATGVVTTEWNRSNSTAAGTTGRPSATPVPGGNASSTCE